MDGLFCSFEDPRGLSTALDQHCPMEQTFTGIESESHLVQAANADVFVKHLGTFNRKQSKHTAHAAIYEEIAHLSNEIRNLQNRMAECEASIVNWKFRQNALNSCVKLPDEIHIEIWKYIVFDSSPSGSSMSSIVIARVCSHWRHIALNTPVLWTRPYIPKPKLTENLLRRAGDMKLTLLLNTQALHMDTRESYSPWPWMRASVPQRCLSAASKRLAATVFARAATLVMDFSESPAEPFRHLGGQEYHERCLGDMTYTAPTKLEYIEIIYPNSQPNHNQNLPDKTILKYIRDSPKLKEIHLTGTSLFTSQTVTSPGGVTGYSLSTGPSLRLIKVLSVSLARYPNTQMASVQEVILTLQHLPLLTTLKLENTFRPLTDQDISWCETHTITLKHLRDLHLVASIQLLSIFLVSVSYHEQARVLLHGAWNERRDPPGIGTLFRYDDALCRVLRTATQRISPFVNFLAISPQLSALGWKLSFAHQQGPSSLASVDVDVGARLGLATELTHICPLDNLHQLHYWFPFADLGMWRSFGMLQKLKILKLDAALHPAFKRAFALLRDSSDTVFDANPPLTPSLGTASVSARFYFPALTQLSCDVSIFRRPKWRPENLRSIEELSRIYAARLCWDDSSGVGRSEKPRMTIY